MSELNDSDVWGTPESHWPNYTDRPPEEWQRVADDADDHWQCKTCGTMLMDFVEIEHGECEGCMVRRLYPHGNPHQPDVAK
jgi:hypothetical protein